jgi:hypothetical protein
MYGCLKSYENGTLNRAGLMGFIRSSHNNDVMRDVK